MSDYVWCHGPNCHTYRTVDRVRGSKDNKVLRTRKIKQYDSDNMFSYFCSNGCYNEFANTYVRQIVAIAPRVEPLETPVEVEKEEVEGWSGRTYIETRIREREV